MGAACTVWRVGAAAACVLCCASQLTAPKGGAAYGAHDSRMMRNSNLTAF